jgi:hypothetical protein
MSAQWRSDLKHLGTTWEKAHITDAPYVIVAFKKAYEFEPGTGRRRTMYYYDISAALACGLLIAAIHHAGLCTLTHTPTPMQFLTRLLGRPKNEKPFLLLPVGYAAPDATVPDIHRKPLDEIMTINRDKDSAAPQPAVGA